MANKKITGNISLTLTAVVNEVSFTPQGHAKHSLGYVLTTEDDEKHYTNWQWLSYTSEGKEAKVYQPGTVLRLTFKAFSTFKSERGGTYLSPDGFVHVDVVKFGDKEQGDSTTQPATYNNKNDNAPLDPVADF